MNESPVQIEVIYTGRVQGVGFRFNAQHIARGFDVRGEVRNLPNGTVQLLAEGERNELERFFAKISQSMGANIERESRTERVYRGDLKGFQIRS